MLEQDFTSILEAILHTANKPLTLKQLQSLFKEAPPDKATLQAALTTLQELYTNRGLELVQVASGYRFQVPARYAAWTHQVLLEKPPRYSRALLETLALIAYRQPITRGEIEDIRGVAVSTSIIRTLLEERQWIRIVGHRDVPGKPSLFATTQTFLDDLALTSLADLPPLIDSAPPTDAQPVEAQLPLPEPPEVAPQQLKKIIADFVEEDVSLEEDVPA